MSTLLLPQADTDAREADDVMHYTCAVCHPPPRLEIPLLCGLTGEVTDYSTRRIPDCPTCVAVGMAWHSVCVGAA